jgi:hypothetical protein
VEVWLMHDILNLLKRHTFKLLVIISICIIFYYIIGGKLLNQSSSINSQNDFSSVSDGDLNDEMFSTQAADKVPAINTVRLADQKKEEQTIIMEDNSKVEGTDVIIAEKNKKANWVFRFLDGKACNGSISIEGFGTIIPVIEKEMVISFVPAKDFTVTCDKGNFKYYVKVIDDFNKTLNITQTTNQNSSAPKPSSPKTSTATPVPNPAPQTQPEDNTTNEETSQPETKTGILDHLFNHVH